MQVEMPKLNSLAHLMIYFGMARLIPNGIGSYGSLAQRGRIGRGTECASTIRMLQGQSCRFDRGYNPLVRDK